MAEAGAGVQRKGLPAASGGRLEGWEVSGRDLLPASGRKSSGSESSGSSLTTSTSASNSSLTRLASGEEESIRSSGSGEEEDPAASGSASSASGLRILASLRPRRLATSKRRFRGNPSSDAMDGDSDVTCGCSVVIRWWWT